MANENQNENETPENGEQISGGPEHGSQFPSDPGAPGGQSEQQPDPAQGNEPVTRQELATFQDSIMEKLDAIGKPTTTSKVEPDPKPTSGENVTAEQLKHLGMTVEEFEREFWDNPAGLMERLMERASQYGQQAAQQVSSQTEFWNSFYTQNKDLAEDKDIVQMVLNNNMKELAEMPVSKASAKLAELTRGRIMKYTSKNTRDMQPGAKVHTEGSEPALPGGKKQEEPKVTSLGDIIRSRKNQRRTGKAMAT